MMPTKRSQRVCKICLGANKSCIYNIVEGPPLQEFQFEQALMKWTEKSRGVFFHTSHGARVTLPRLSSCRAPILQEKGLCDSLRQTPGENTVPCGVH